MTNPVPKLQKRLHHAWSVVVAALEEISNVSDVKPSSAADVFRVTAQDGILRVDVRPVTFRVTQQAKSTRADLFIVLEGWILFSERDMDGDLRSFGYKSEVGYFQVRSAKTVKAVLGLHYDWDEHSLAHPLYHSQIFSAEKFVPVINGSYHKEYSPEEPPAIGLKNIRIPTAQMDAFCVIAQIFSDHLVNAAISDEVRDAYDKLMRACSFFECSAREVGHCERAFERRSFRSPHWYPGADVASRRGAPGDAAKRGADPSP